MPHYNLLNWKDLYKLFHTSQSAGCLTILLDAPLRQMHHCARIHHLCQNYSCMLQEAENASLPWASTKGNLWECVGVFFFKSRGLFRCFFRLFSENAHKSYYSKSWRDLGRQLSPITLPSYRSWKSHKSLHCFISFLNVKSYGLYILWSKTSGHVKINPNTLLTTCTHALRILNHFIFSFFLASFESCDFPL